VVVTFLDVIHHDRPFSLSNLAHTKKAVCLALLRTSTLNSLVHGRQTCWQKGGRQGCTAVQSGHGYIAAERWYRGCSSESEGTHSQVEIHDALFKWGAVCDASLQMLGKGRSGTVTRNLWEEVAVKTFSLAKDDERDFFEVRVLLSLRSLWGTHVPALLFRQPWMSSPMIGLELGERMKDDMSEWDPKDRQKAKETIAKVAALGYDQQDERGANVVVRLHKGENYWIAMIDFETVRKIAYNTPGQG
jgi:hypothetical protein